MIAKLKKAGVSVSGGQGYHVMKEEKGWARLAFALNTSQLREALKRINGVLSGNVQVKGNIKKGNKGNVNSRVLRSRISKANGRSG